MKVDKSLLSGLPQATRVRAIPAASRVERIRLFIINSPFIRNTLRKKYLACSALCE